MGAGNSKPEDSTKHVFKSDHPIAFSQELVEALQASPETNSTRAKSLELHIAQRVAEELRKIQEQETSKFDSIRQKISSNEEDSSSKDTKDSPSAEKSGSSSTLQKAVDLVKPDTDKSTKSQTSQKVQEEIEKLKAQLGQRKVLNELPKEVEQARQGVISCLRTNDKRPLDCWREVEVFKREVRKLEEKFVGDVL